MMSSTFSHLFTEINLRGRRLRNRIVFGAHTANMAVEGLPGPGAILFLLANDLQLH